LLTRIHVPDPHDLVPAGDGEPLPIGAERQTRDVLEIPDAEQLACGRGVPDLDADLTWVGRLDRGEATAVRAEHYAPEHSVVLAEQERLAASQIPALQFSLRPGRRGPPAGRRQPLPVGTGHPRVDVGVPVQLGREEDGLLTGREVPHLGGFPFAPGEQKSLPADRPSPDTFVRTPEGENNPAVA